MRRILCIDDLPAANRDLVGQWTAAGWAVQVLEDWRQGVDCLRRETAALVVVSTSVPHICGLEAVWAVRAAAPQTPLMAIAGGPPRFHGVYLGAARHGGARWAFGRPGDDAAILAAVEACMGLAQPG